MNKKTTRVIAGTLAVLMLVTGCKNSSSSSEKAKSTDQTSSSAVQLNRYGEKISVGDIKSVYEDETNSLMPLYNVAQDETFKIKFNFSLDKAMDGSITEDYVTVHTDSKCLDESKIYVYNNRNYDEELENLDIPFEVEVAPIAPVLATDSQDNAYVYEDSPTWGNASIYYMAIWYDMEADTIVKLDTPIIVPFTVKNEVQAPNVRGVVDSTGRFKLEWDEIEGAEKYIIYQLTNLDEHSTSGESNQTVKGAEFGYNESALIYDHETTETEFDNFAGEGHGLVEISDFINPEITYITGQNYSVYGEFYVSAVVNGVESGLGAGVPTCDLKIPMKLTEESDIGGNVYASVDDLPKSLDVINIDGSITSRNVYYTFEMQETFNDIFFPGYRFTIEGTAISDCISMEDWDAEYPETVGSESTTGSVEPENNINKTPDKDVETIIPPADDDTEVDPDKTLVEQQKDNTEKHIEKGDKDEIVNPENDVVIFADSASEEWLALSLVNGETDISFESFPEMQDPNQLEDMFYKVYYQNPYVLGLKSFAYDYNTMTLKVTYLYDADTIKAKQAEMTAAANDIISSVITDEMSDDEKRLALYNYLEANCEYDNEALADAEKNGYVKTDDNTFEDSFNCYGILVNKKGVCQSYAYTYKLLCSMAGVECKVITGYLNGNLPHAWNTVQIDGKWYQTDPTNNANSTGIPYFLYNADTATAEQTGFTTDKFFELDSAVSEYNTEDTSIEYYHANELVADDLDQYSDILDKNLSENSVTICVRYGRENPSQEDVANTVKEVYNKHNLESKLPTLGLGTSNGYIILIQE